MSEIKRALSPALRWLAICASTPLVQSVLLHLAFHARFGPNNVVLGNYTWDIVPILGAAAAYCFVTFYQRALFTPRFSRRCAIAVSALTFLLAGWLGGYPKIVHALGPEVATAVLLAASGSWLLCGALLFLDVPGGWRAAFRAQAPRFLYAAVGFAALALLPRIQESCWLLLSRITGLTAYVLIKLTGTSVVLHVSPYISLQNRFFFADVKSPCSGLEGIGYFFFLYALVRVLEGFSLRPWREMQVGLVGLATVLFLNGLRIALLFVAAVNARRYLSSRAVSEAFVWAFHSNVGWLLYLVGLLFFFRYVFRLRPRASFQSAEGVN